MMLESEIVNKTEQQRLDQVKNWIEKETSRTETAVVTSVKSPKKEGVKTKSATAKSSALPKNETGMTCTPPAAKNKNLKRTSV
jgi:hypothetical protein